MKELFDKYEVSEISKKTHISPMTLKKLFDNEFEGMSEIRVNGFINILEEEYPKCDFSSLKEAKEEYFSKPKEQEEDKENIIEEENGNNFFLYAVVGILVVAIVLLFAYFSKTQTSVSSSEMNTSKTKIVENNSSNSDFNSTQNNIENSVNQAKKTTEITNTQKIEQNNTIAILPQEKVWFRVTYLNTNSSKEYLTSHEIDLNGSKDLFIKFGHGMELIKYHSHTLFPNTKKIVYIVLQNGELNITKHRLGYYSK
jgi:hypothetical protein